MIKKIELLVHAGAPSSRKDDDKYKAQVQAYLAFDGRIVATASPISTKAQDAQDATPVERQPTELTSARANFLDDTQLAYTALDNQLFTSSLLVDGDSIPGPVGTASLDIPGLYQLSAEGKPARSSGCADASNGAIVESGHHSGVLQGRYCDFQASRKRPDGESNPSTTRLPHESPPDCNNVANHAQSQSSYLKSPVLHRSDRKRKASSDLQQAPHSGHPTSSRRRLVGQDVMIISHRGVARTDPMEERDISRSQTSGGTNHTTSELPTSYSLSDVTSESSRAKPSVSQRSASDPGPRTSSASPAAVRSVPTSDQVVPLPPPVLPPGNERPIAPDAKNEPQTASKGAPNTSAQDVHELNTLSTSIYPPQPAVAIKSYTTHVTDALRSLAENPDIKHSYKPISVVRELRPLERGHWLVNCINTQTWGLQDQIDFWRFLEKTIPSKAVGWGVWCTREYATAGEGTVADEASLGGIKVFCWGEIVSHIFLLLYVASKSKVRKLGLQWFDAEDRVVVQMRGS